jgi:hypothetical protein
MLFLFFCRLEFSKITWEEKEFKDEEHDKQFNQNNKPKSFSQCHLTEALHIKPEYSNYNRFLFHNAIS